MRRDPARLLSALLLLAASAHASCEPGPRAVLDRQSVLEGHDWWDNRDWTWYLEKIPFFDSPDHDLNATYYYRWEVLTKHLVYGSPQTGYTLTEFIDRPFWSGSYGAISCPLGHQAYELRWLKDRRVIRDFARYWFETPGAEPRSYSNWYGDAMWATYEVLADSAFLRAVYPHMEAQVEGWTRERWDPDHGMYRWVGAWDGMETNINSRLTEDPFGGGEGYRPTLNAYLYGDLRALSRTAALFGEGEKSEAYAARAQALKARVQEELWDPGREFFFHQFAEDERDGIRARSLTYETGPFAGSPHGRELLGYVPWQFGLPDPGYESAWRFLLDPEYFWAPFGPTGVEQGDPQFLVSPRCCVWSGNAWPYATAQTLTAMANLLQDYDQDVVGKADYFTLLRTYALSHRADGRPFVAEALDPFTGSWAGHNTFFHSEHYLHSGFLDQVITGLVGLRPRPDDTLRVRPLVPEDWDYFALEGVDYHGHDLALVWDRDGTRYGVGPGFSVHLDGRELARRPEPGEIRVPISRPVSREPDPPLHNYAVNNDGAPYPYASASSSHPVFPPFYAVDGNRWYHPSPPNRWVSGEATEGGSPPWFEVDFGIDRPLTEVRLFFLDDVSGPPREAVGEEETSGFPRFLAAAGPPPTPPDSFSVQRFDGVAWVEVEGQRTDPGRPEGRRANTIRFPEVRASRLRVVLFPGEGSAVGLTELEAWGPGSLPIPRPGAPNSNLALNPDGEGAPRASASFTHAEDSPWEALDGRISFTRYARNRWTAFGTPNSEDWLEVDFGRAVEVGRAELFFFGDGRGVAAPRAYLLEVWNGHAWEEVETLSREPRMPTAWAVNTALFEPVSATRFRVKCIHDLPAASGLVEVRVFPR